MSKKEYKIGERIVLDVVENDTVTCTGCFLTTARVLVKCGKNIHA